MNCRLSDPSSSFSTLSIDNVDPNNNGTSTDNRVSLGVPATLPMANGVMLNPDDPTANLTLNEVLRHNFNKNLVTILYNSQDYVVDVAVDQRFVPVRRTSRETLRTIICEALQIIHGEMEDETLRTNAYRTN
jgi:hypothetical protein